MVVITRDSAWLSWRAGNFDFLWTRSWGKTIICQAGVRNCLLKIVPQFTVLPVPSASYGCYSHFKSFLLLAFISQYSELPLLFLLLHLSFFENGLLVSFHPFEDVMLTSDHDSNGCAILASHQQSTLSIYHVIPSRPNSGGANRGREVRDRTPRSRATTKD
jgi:hypothetical protein